VLVRVHEPVSLIDLLDAGGTRHSWNFHDAMKAIAAADCGVILLLHRQETASELLERAQPPGSDAPPPKVALLNYGIGAQILRDLKVKKMRLLALPRRMPSMAGFDLEVVGYLQPGEE
jgi:3,4-dihydroxy 2-butanone 4-phosphate synthase/GTP cyclohydrolase II